jgi:hypothetical protein
MTNPAILCAVHIWDASQALIKASFDTIPIQSEYQQYLYVELQKRGIAPVQRTPDSKIVLYGRYVRIDEGDRAVRYVATFLAGQAAVEVDGGLWVDAKGTWRVATIAREGWGLFGGDSKDLLKKCARKCAENIATQVQQLLRQAQVM